MPKVILFEPVRPEIDVSSSEEFGEIVYLFNKHTHRCSAFNSNLFQETVLARLEEVGFNSDEDFICAAGSMLTLTVSLIGIARRYDSFNMLIFSSTEGRYIHRVFDKHEFNAINQDKVRDK